jgi:hypothetical protein
MGRGSARAQALCERRARSRGGCDSARTSVSSSGPISEDVHDAHIEGGVPAIGAGEHVHRRAVPQGEAAAEHVRHLGVLRRAGLVGAHRLDHHAVEDLRVRLGRQQTSSTAGNRLWRPGAYSCGVGAPGSRSVGDR